jgi:hypothetical protein
VKVAAKPEVEQPVKTVPKPEAQLAPPQEPIEKKEEEVAVEVVDEVAADIVDEIVIKEPVPQTRSDPEPIEEEGEVLAFLACDIIAPMVIPGVARLKDESLNPRGDIVAETIKAGNSNTGTKQEAKLNGDIIAKQASGIGVASAQTPSIGPDPFRGNVGNNFMKGEGVQIPSGYFGNRRG